MQLAKTLPDIVNYLQKKQPFQIVVLPKLSLHKPCWTRFSDLSLLIDALENTSSVTELDATHDVVTFPLIVKSLHKNSSITSLDLSKNQTCNAISALSEALKVNKTIKELILRDLNIKSDDLRSLSEALKVSSTLKRLDLSSNYLPQDAIGELGTALQINTSLKSLSVTFIAKSLFSALKLNTSLTHLDLSNSNIANLELYNLMAHNKHIKDLDLSGCVAKIAHWREILDFLSTNDTLTCLTLTSANLTAEHYQVIARGLKTNKTLKTLITGMKTVQQGAEKGSFTESLAEALRTNQSLTELKIEQLLGHEEISCFVGGLHSNSTLVKLSLAVSRVTTPVLVSFREWFANGGQLEELELESSQIDADNMELKRFVALPFKSLGLIRCVSYVQQEIVAQGLKDNKTLIRLSIPSIYEPMSSRQAVLLADFLNHSTTLRKLDISGLRDTAALIHLLLPTCQLRHLIMDGGYNRSESQYLIDTLEKELFASLTHYLKVNKNIRVIELKEVQASSTYAKKFLESLGDNTTLVDLITPDNRAQLLCPELREKLQNNQLQTFQRARVNVYVLARNDQARSAIPFELWIHIFEFISPEFAQTATLIWNDCFTIERHDKWHKKQ